MTNDREEWRYLWPKDTSKIWELLEWRDSKHKWNSWITYNAYDFMASSCGRIARRSKRRGGFFVLGSVYMTNTKVEVISIYDNTKAGKVRRIPVARLVCTAFHGLPEKPELVAVHKDSNPKSNRPENLFWGTPRDAMQIYIDNNPSRWGEQSPLSRLSSDDVHAIRQRHLAGDSYPTIARDYGLHQEHVGRICRGERWRRLETPGWEPALRT